MVECTSILLLDLDAAGDEVPDLHVIQGIAMST